MCVAPNIASSSHTIIQLGTPIPEKTGTPLYFSVTKKLSIFSITLNF